MLFISPQLAETIIHVADEAGMSRYVDQFRIVERKADHLSRPVIRVLEDVSIDPVDPLDDCLLQVRMDTGKPVGVDLTGYTTDTDDDGNTITVPTYSGTAAHPVSSVYFDIYTPGNNPDDRAPFHTEVDAIRNPGWAQRHTEETGELLPDTILRFPMRVKHVYDATSGTWGYRAFIGQVKGMGQLSAYRFAVADDTYDPAAPTQPPLRYVWNNPAWTRIDKATYTYWRATTDFAGGDGTATREASYFVLLPDGQQTQVAWGYLPADEDRVDLEYFV